MLNREKLTRTIPTIFSTMYDSDSEYESDSDSEGPLNYYHTHGHTVTGLPELYSGLEQLVCTESRIVYFPELPPSLTDLSCPKNGYLKELPTLPETLEILYCSNCRQLTSLPELPPRLKTLWCFNNWQLKILPDLPSSLERLDCSCTGITELPELPEGLKVLDTSNCPNLMIQRLPKESILHYRQRWIQWREEKESKARVQQRHRDLKEDLIAEFWKPSRVEKMLEFGGWDLVDSY